MQIDQHVKHAISEPEPKSEIGDGGSPPEDGLSVIVRLWPQDVALQARHLLISEHGSLCQDRVVGRSCTGGLGANLDNVTFDTVWRGEDLQGFPTEEVLNWWIVSTRLLSHDVLTPQVKVSVQNPGGFNYIIEFKGGSLLPKYDGRPYGRCAT
jgi:hypothetical protein